MGAVPTQKRFPEEAPLIEGKTQLDR